MKLELQLELELIFYYFLIAILCYIILCIICYFFNLYFEEEETITVGDLYMSGRLFAKKNEFKY